MCIYFGRHHILRGDLRVKLQAELYEKSCFYENCSFKTTTEEEFNKANQDYFSKKTGFPVITIYFQQLSDDK